MLMPHITQKYKDNLDAARNANHSLAVFIKVGAPPDADTSMRLKNWPLVQGPGELGVTCCVLIVCFSLFRSALLHLHGQRLRI